MMHDIHVALRSLLRVKAFSAAAVSTLAVGMCGTIVMFTLIEGILLRPLPVRDQERLIIAWKEVRTAGSAEYPFGDREIESVARASRLIERAAGLGRNGVGRSVVSDAAVSDYANVATVTGAFFEVLGVQPVLGRALVPTDDKEGVEHVVVLSSGFWRRRYGASHEVIGRRLTLDDQPFTVVGVMPGDLDVPRDVEIWRTTHSFASTGPFGDAARREVNLIARLRPGVTIQQAASEIVSLSEQLEADLPATAERGLVPVVRPFSDIVLGQIRTPLLALFAAVALVLLIASANVANLLVMRGESRRAELAVQVALGASPGRIARQLLAESLILTVVGGLIGCLAAWWSLQALVAFIPGGLPRVESVHPDITVVLFSAAVILLTALLTGLAPARASLRADVVAPLRAGGRGATGRRSPWGRALVVAQVGLAVAVVAAAGLLVRSVLKLQAVDLGLPADRLGLVDLHIPPAKYAQRSSYATFLDQAIAALQSGSVIAAATPVNLSPFTGYGWDLPRWSAEGQNEQQGMANPSLDIESIHSNYFATMQVTIIRGRAFTEGDRERAMPVAIVSDDVAERTWPRQNPLGKRLKMGGIESREPWLTVVGVAVRTRYRTVLTPRPTLYLPAAQFQMTATMLVVRTNASLEAVASFARERIRSIDAEVQVMRVARFDDMLARPLAGPRFTSFLLSVFAAAALFLSTIGLYAVMSAFVRQREREIAVRLALGATIREVRRFVLAEALRLAGLGVAIGLAGAIAATRVLRGILFEVHPLDPSTLMAAILLLLCASALASYLPLRRATRLDPIVALRAP